MSTKETAESILANVADGDEVLYENSIAWPASDVRLFAQAYLDLATLEPLCRELVTEIEAGRGGYVAFQKIRKVLNG